MVKGKRKGKAGALRRIGRCWQLYVLMLPALVYIVLFAYKPMYGILIAFKDFSMKKGILASPWVGFKNFERLFSSYWFLKEYADDQPAEPGDRIPHSDYTGSAPE